jgi:hypothetical protein
MPPSRVADLVFDAIEKEQFYILTEPEWIDVIRIRTTRLLLLENPENPASAVAQLLDRRR